MSSDARKILSPETRRAALHHAWAQLPFFLWLIALWMLLWGQFTVLAFVSGLIVAIVVTNVFKLPAAELSGRVNFWYGLVFSVTFLWAVVKGALSVSWQVLDPRRRALSAIVAVQMRTEDDLIMTHVGVTASLIPGSLIVETDRDRFILYLHVIGVRDLDDVDDFRRGVLRWEHRIVRAVGSRAQVEALKGTEDAERPARDTRDARRISRAHRTSGGRDLAQSPGERWDSGHDGQDGGHA